MIYEDRLTGLISLGEKKSGKFYRREDIDLLNTLANQGAVAIENARCFRKYRKRAHGRRTQHRPRSSDEHAAGGMPDDRGLILPPIPSRPGRLGEIFTTLSIWERKGGICHWRRYREKCFRRPVCRASRSVFRMLSEENLTVSESMMRANRRLKKDIKSGMFVALLFAVMDSQGKMLTLCSAGQTQPVLMSAKTSEATLVETLGDTFPLGILEDAEL